MTVLLPEQTTDKTSLIRWWWTSHNDLDSSFCREILGIFWLLIWNFHHGYEFQSTRETVTCINLEILKLRKLIYPPLTWISAKILIKCSGDIVQSGDSLMSSWVSSGHFWGHSRIAISEHIREVCLSSSEATVREFIMADLIDSFSFWSKFGQLARTRSSRRPFKCFQK